MGTKSYSVTLITLSWKGQLGTNTLAYWTLHKLLRKQSVVNTAPGVYMYIYTTFERYDGHTISS